MSIRAHRTLVALASGLCALAGVLAGGAAPAGAALQTTYLRQLSGFEFMEAGSVAVDNVSHDVFVANQGTVQEFDSLGVRLATWNGSNTPAGSFGGPLGVALNDATGRVYVTDKSHQVVDIFSSEGEYLSQFGGSGTPAKSFGSYGPAGAAIDQANGEVYVPDPGNNVVDVFDASGKYVSQFAARTLANYNGGGPVSVTVDDPAGEVLVAESSNQWQGAVVYVYDLAGKPLTTWTGSNTPIGFGSLLTVTADEATGDVLVGSASREPEGERETAPSVVDVLDPAGDYLSPQITGTPEGVFARSYNAALGVAIDPSTGEIYISDKDVVDVFSSVVVPGVIAGAPSSHPPGDATLSGTVNPDGLQVAECLFEYGIEMGSYPNTVPCSQSPAQIGEGHKAIPVSADISSLQPDESYHFRLRATNENGTNTGEDATFFTSTAPVIEGQAATSVVSAGAAVSARIDAAAVTTSYRVEYGTSTAYGSSTATAQLGNAEDPIPVLVQLSGLQPGTQYHYRFVAANSFGVTAGTDETFTTLRATGASNSSLPDGRQYELVTAPTEDSDVYVPLASYSSTQEFNFSQLPAQTSPEGNALVYIGDPAPGGDGSSGNGLGNQFFASRNAAGHWSSLDITPTAIPVYTGKYVGFSSDLSVGVLSSYGELPVTPEASRGCTTLYSRPLGSGLYSTLFDGTKSAGEPCFEPRFAGASADGSRIAFEMPAALTPEAPGGGTENLYEYVEGSPRLVNVLPNGEPAVGARFGSSQRTLYSHVVSADGTRLFWTDLANGDLYAREDAGTSAARTVLIAEGGEYQTASADGSVVIFTKAGSLYTYDVDTAQTSELVHEGEVQGLLGASDDGSYVYFVAKSALRGAQGEPLRNNEGAQPTAGEENLYLIHAGAQRFIVTLAEGDADDWLDGIEGGGEVESPYATSTAEVASGGHAAVFSSTRSLTGYDNRSANEIYVYQADANRLYCASCNPSGAPPEAGGGRLSTTTSATSLPRWINEDGSEVFFESAEPLVAQHSNGQVGVFEWEREGAGSCQFGDGCIYLLSGDVGRQAVFVDASASGRDVFFVTRAHLLPEEEGDNALIYDARVSSRAVSPPLCTGTGCQGTPSAPPIFATPASATFNGVGNFPSSPLAKATKKKTTSKCAKGKRLSHGKCLGDTAKRGKHHKKGKRSKKRSKQRRKS